MKRKYPKKLYRDDDGQEFHLIDESGLYSIYNGDLGLGIHKYNYHELKGFKLRLKDCNIVPVKKTNSGCGDDE